MKFIVSSRTNAYLSLHRARNLCHQLTNEGITYIERRSMYSFPTPEMAEKACLRALMETHEDYTFLFAGTENLPFEGTKALIICIKELPPLFEEKYTDYHVIGN